MLLGDILKRFSMTFNMYIVDAEFCPDYCVHSHLGLWPICDEFRIWASNIAHFILFYRVFKSSIISYFYFVFNCYLSLKVMFVFVSYHVVFLVFIYVRCHFKLCFVIYHLVELYFIFTMSRN